MAKEVINIGTGELTGDGETLRSALNKVNLNFTELYDDDANDITLASFSATTNAASGTGSLAYDNTSGAFSLTPPVTDVVEDTTPQLGGALDTNGNNITFSGTTKAQFGAAQDLSIFHNNNHSIIRETGTGNLYLQSDNNVILSTDSGTNIMVKGIANGSTELYHNGIKKFDTGSHGVDVVDEAHIEGATPHLTLKRTDNANVPTVRFKGSGGVIGASIDFDGTSGTTNELAFQVYDGATIAERFRVTYTGAKITGTLNGHTIPAGAGTIALTSDITSLADTDALPEGSTNLYYTDARADARADVRAQLKIDALVDTAPGTMDTLNELAAALGDDPNFATTTATSIAEKLPLAGGTMTGAIDMGSNNITTTGKMLFANMYATEGDLPSATTYHGMFAHVHGTGAGYFAHGGNWVKLANYTDLSAYQTTGGLGGNIDLHLNQSNPTSGYVLSWNGSDYAWVAQSGGGGGSSNAISQLNSNVTVTDTGTDGTITFDTDGTDRWQFTSAGHLIPVADTSYDIGNASNKVRHLFLSDSSIKWGAAELPMTVVSSRLHFNGIELLTETSTTDINMNVSGAGLGIKIGQASTSGSTISIGSEVNTTSVSMNGLTDFNARVTFDRGVAERFYTITGATGTVTHNCQWGHIWYHTGVAADFTANITNLALTQEDTTNVAVVVNQGGTGYIPNAVEIDGVAQTIVWQGNSAPTATANGVDTFSFTIMNDGGTYMVLGQMTSFGGV